MSTGARTRLQPSQSCAMGRHNRAYSFLANGFAFPVQFVDELRNNPIIAIIGNRLHGFQDDPRCDSSSLDTTVITEL